MNRYLLLSAAIGTVLRQANEDNAAGTGADDANTAPDAEIARKLQAKVIVGSVKRYVPKLGGDDKPTGKIQPLYQIWGHASGTKRGETDFGQYVALTGRFEAINVCPKLNRETGELDYSEINGTMFAGPVCFLPEPMASMLADQLEHEEPELDDKGDVKLVNGVPKMRRLVDSLEFAFEIGVKATETAVGYEYTTKPIIKAGGADPLASLRKRIPLIAARSAPALPAPAAGAAGSSEAPEASAAGAAPAAAKGGTKAKGK